MGGAPDEGNKVEEEDTQVEGHEAVVEHRRCWPEFPTVELHLGVLCHDLARQMLHPLDCTPLCLVTHSKAKLEID
jgi:hypothetical protein